MSVICFETFNRKRLYIALCSLLWLPLMAEAQESKTEEGELEFGEAFVLDEIVVTGLRQSLQDASEFKRNSINITDSVFSEDVGKFPDLNIAEAINRIPGIQLSREIDGSGVNVAIRGLNTNFTKVTLNGAQIAVASSGKTDSINSNRELDLDVFPTEFFTRLDVSKTTTASMLEGGLSGTVNMRSLRPMDNNAGDYVNYQLQMGYGEASEDISPRASLIGSWTNSDSSFGVLAGVAAVNNKVVTRGYESEGWTNANLTFDQCGLTPPEGSLPGLPAANCSGNSGGGNQFVIGMPMAVDPSTGSPTGGQAGYHVVPNNTQITGSSGTVYGPGAVIDQNFLLDVNPGLTIDQIGEALIPRLGRPHYSEGDRDRIAGILSLEWKPNEHGNYFMDVLYAKADRDYNRLSMTMVGRNSQLIPVNMQVDENNVVTQADFYNARFELNASPYSEALDFYSINPGASFFIGDDFIIDTQINTTKSNWSRESPSLAFATNSNAGIAASYSNVGGEYPLVSSNIDLNDPNQVSGWNIERAFVQNEERETETLGARLDFTIGGGATNFKFGTAYDELQRSITGRDNPSWEQHVLDQIPANTIPNYLVPGPDGFVMIDYDPFFDATDYAQYSSTAGVNTTSNTGAPTGSIDETSIAGYLEGNYEHYLGFANFRLNGGVRFVTTEQTVVGVQRSGNEFLFNEDTSDYSNTLPSLNMVFEFTEDFLLRTALSRTLTRPNPADMLPSTIFVDPSAQYANQGNPDLKPFTSDNLDIGLEWYFKDEGYASATVFRKQINGLTAVSVEPIVVNDLLSQIGISYQYLSPSQRDAIDQRGGPSVATVGMVKEVNVEGKLDLKGVELLWVQPLPMIVDGLGYSVNMTHVDQKPKGSGAPAFATEVSENTVNATIYYETEKLTLRLSNSWYDKQYGSQMGQDDIATAQRYIDARSQWDFSASYELSSLPTTPKITFNLINFGSDPQREVFSYDNAAYRYYDPGYTAIIGFRGVFN